MQTFFMLFNNSLALLELLFFFYRRGIRGERKGNNDGKVFSFIAVVELENQRIFICSFLDKKKRGENFGVTRNTSEEKKSDAKHFTIRNIMENKCKNFVTPDEL